MTTGSCDNSSSRTEKSTKKVCWTHLSIIHLMDATHHIMSDLLSIKIIPFGKVAIPDLLKTIASSEWGKCVIELLMSYQALKGLTKVILMSLIASLNRGQAWHVNRIREIGSPKAINALFEKLEKKWMANQYRDKKTSFVILGEKRFSHTYSRY